MTFSENLKKVRNASGFTASEVAQMIGTTDSAYRNYEAGCREMPMRVQEKFADAMGIDLELLYEEGNLCLDNMLSCAFRIDKISDKDAQEIIAFKRIVLNYLKMERLLNE